MAAVVYLRPVSAASVLPSYCILGKYRDWVGREWDLARNLPQQSLYPPVALVVLAGEAKAARPHAG